MNTTTDTVDAMLGDGACADAGGACSLRAAIQEANNLAGADTIMIPAGTYVLAIAGANEDAAVTGDLDITEEVTITGAGPASTIVDGGALDRIFDISSSASTVRISGLTIRNGNPGPGAYGGGLYNSSTLTLSQVVVTGNTAAVSGGGIENDNDITLGDCTVSGNSAAMSGGGIDNALTARLNRVTVNGNMSGTGAGIANIFDLTLLNVTVSGNTATTSGGGIENDGAGTTALTGVTIAHNVAPAGAGIYAAFAVTSAYVLVANDPSAINCGGAGPFTSHGHNLDSGNTCHFGAAGDLVNLDPQLGPLGDNGGATATHALSPGSPAIDAGGADCPPPNTDQRGLPRPVDGNGDGVAACDIGSYEAASTTTTTLPAGCTTEPTFASIDCRLDDLIQTVQMAVPAGALRDAMTGQLMTAKRQASQAAQALAAGKKRRERALLGKSIRALGKFNRRVGSRKAQNLVPAEVLARARGTSDQLRSDLRTLRASH